MNLVDINENSLQNIEETILNPKLLTKKFIINKKLMQYFENFSTEVKLIINFFFFN